MISPPDVVTAEEWSRCSPWIEDALVYAQGTHELIDVLAEIDAGRATLWPFERSCLVSQIIDYPRLRQFSYWLAGGDLDDLLSKEAGIREWAASQGCTRMVVPGRMGWRRVMAPFGFGLLCEIVFKDI